MFTCLYYFLFIHLVSGVDEEIVQCVKDVVKTTDNMIKKRPSIDPSSCLDLDADSCTLLFMLADQNNYAIQRNTNP